MREFIDPEPHQGIDEDDDAFNYRWVPWARDQLELLGTNLTAALVAKDKAVTELKECKELLEAYRKVQDKTQRITCYNVGDKVYVGPKEVEATVLGIIIKGTEQVDYLVAWWEGNNYKSIVLPADQVTDDRPLQPLPH